MTDPLSSETLIRRSDVGLMPDAACTVLRPFDAGEPPEAFADRGETRAVRVCRRLMRLAGDKLGRALDPALTPLGRRHRDLLIDATLGVDALLAGMTTGAPA